MVRTPAWESSVYILFFPSCTLSHFTLCLCSFSSLSAYCMALLLFVCCTPSPSASSFLHCPLFLRASIVVALVKATIPALKEYNLHRLLLPNIGHFLRRFFYFLIHTQTLTHVYIIYTDTHSTSSFILHSLQIIFLQARVAGSKSEDKAADAGTLELRVECKDVFSHSDWQVYYLTHLFIDVLSAHTCIRALQGAKNRRWDHFFGSALCSSVVLRLLR